VAAVSTETAGGYSMEELVHYGGLGGAVIVRSEPMLCGRGRWCCGSTQARIFKFGGEADNSVEC
jgi:hypothetical protein